MRPRRKGERGFVLLVTIWLLLLCAAMVAVLMLRGQQHALEAADVGDRLKTRLALESAVEMVIGDILFRGPASRWIVVPGQGQVDVGGTPVGVTMTSEDGRLDLNEVDLDTLDTALRGFGVTATARGAMIGQVKAARDEKRRIASWAEVERIVALAGSASPGGPCLLDELTIYSGRGQPNQRHMDTGLARALGIVRVGDTGGTIDPGSAVRIVATMPKGARLVAVVRITGLVDEPYLVSYWRVGSSGCGTPPQSAAPPPAPAGSR